MTDLETWFDTFWQTYPSDLTRKRKGPKSVALKSVIKLAPDKALQELIMGNLRELIRYDRREDKANGNTQIWPHASTWINQERWTMIENIGSYSDLNEKITGKKCKCGGDTDIGSECWTCHDKKQGNRYDAELKAELVRIGLWKTDGETVQAWQQRCKQWVTKENRLGGFQSRGAE